MPRGGAAEAVRRRRRVRREIRNFIPTVEFHSSARERPYRRIAIIPSLMSRRFAIVRAIRIPMYDRQNSIFANYSATFSHPPLFRGRGGSGERGPHCVPEHNGLFRPVVRAPSSLSLSSRLSRQVCTRGFIIYGVRHDQLIIQRELLRARRGEAGERGRRRTRYERNGRANVRRIRARDFSFLPKFDAGSPLRKTERGGRLSRTKDVEFIAPTAVIVIVIIVVAYLVFSTFK